MRHALCLGLLLTAVAGCDDTTSSPSSDARVPDAAPADAAPDLSPVVLPPPECTVRGPEVCNRFDDDCDGATDEGFAVGAPCVVGVGACAAEGVTRCTAAGDDVECPASAGEPSAEVCDGVDDDCDGTVDEGIEAAPCETGLPGVCASGAAACAEGAVGCAPVTAPGDERCDGLDNDCDGAVDEGIEAAPCYTGPADTRGVGICRDGLLGCVDGAPTCVGEVVPPAGLVFEERRHPLRMACISSLLVDLNADGALDIVCHNPGHPGTPEISLLVNDGVGGFAAPVEFELTDQPFGDAELVAADVDLDGTVDLVAGVERGIVVIADPLGEAPEPVTLQPVLEIPGAADEPIDSMYGLAVADLTGDGAPDIAFVSARTQPLPLRYAIALAVNQGDGTFAVPRAIGDPPTPASSLTAHDIDRDGAIDLLVCPNPRGAALGVYFMRGGPGGPAGGVAQIDATPCGPRLVADVTGDGRLDLLTSNYWEVWHAPFEPGPALGERVAFARPAGALNPLRIGIGQLDCDPEPEVLALDWHPSMAPPVVYAFLDATTLLDPVVMPHDPTIFSLAIGDIDGDGADDIVIGSDDGVRVHRRVP